MYTLNIDSDVTNCAAQATTNGNHIYADAVTSGTQVLVRTWALNSTAQPVATSADINVSVTC